MSDDRRNPPRHRHSKRGQRNHGDGPRDPAGGQQPQHGGQSTPGGHPHQGARPRHGQPRGGSRPSPNRMYDSTGPSGRVRGTAQQIADRYDGMAVEAVRIGDEITAQNYRQHAEHYRRLARESGGTTDTPPPDGTDAALENAAD